MADFSVESLGGGWYRLSDGERRWRVAAAGTGETRWIFVDGHVATVSIGGSDGAGRKKRTTDAGVMAPMPATVIALNAVKGQSVKHGDTLIVLEAMKMEMPVRAPRDGVVKAVHCAKGDLVQPGVNLLEFE